jgi:antirestriction protein ArdC
VNYTQLCEEITASIVDALETDAAQTWLAPWHRIGAGWAPRNAKTGQWYGGSNVINLACEALEPLGPNHDSFPSSWWATYKQWSDIGGQVRKGEKSTAIVKWVPKSNKTAGHESAPPTTPDGSPMTRLHGPQLIPKVYGVFNVAQVDGWEPPSPKDLADHCPIGAAETWIASSGADIGYGFDHACYMPQRDRIEVPALGQYDDPLDHYSTVGHELIHWTGHPSRLRRDLSGRFGDDDYAAEELVAELGSALTAARLGLTNTPRADHIAYLGHWLRILKADPKALFAAASQAQRAVDYIANRTTQPKPTDALSLEVTT